MANNTRSNQPGSSMQSRQQQSSQAQQDSSKQNVEQKANQAAEQVAQKAQSTFENARSSVAQQLTAVARAIESASDTLEQRDQTGLSRRIQQYVQKAEDASNYLRDKSPRELKDDLDRLARKRPAWFLGGAFVVGLFAARFLKSSEQKGSVEYATA